MAEAEAEATTRTAKSFLVRAVKSLSEFLGKGPSVLFAEVSQNVRRARLLRNGLFRARLGAAAIPFPDGIQEACIHPLSRARRETGCFVDHCTNHAPDTQKNPGSIHLTSQRCACLRSRILTRPVWPSGSVAQAVSCQGAHHGVQYRCHDSAGLRVRAQRTSDGAGRGVAPLRLGQRASVGCSVLGCPRVEWAVAGVASFSRGVLAPRRIHERY